MCTIFRHAALQVCWRGKGDNERIEPRGKSRANCIPALELTAGHRAARVPAAAGEQGLAGPAGRLPPRGPPSGRGRGVPAICSGRAGCRGLSGSPAPRLALSTTSWSARQKSPSSRSANSSPGMSWRLQATQRKHSMWYTLERARITKSFLLKPMLHLAHLIPYNLRGPAGGREAQGQRSLQAVTAPPETADYPATGPEPPTPALSRQAGNGRTDVIRSRPLLPFFLPVFLLLNLSLYLGRTSQCTQSTPRTWV